MQASDRFKLALDEPHACLGMPLACLLACLGMALGQPRARFGPTYEGLLLLEKTMIGSTSSRWKAYSLPD